MRTTPFTTKFFASSSMLLLALGSGIATADSGLEEVTVIADRLFKDTALVSPSSQILTEELELVNITTAEDLLSHEPNIVVRKRFIGDPNGVVGIRGSNMFQTPRTMVFVDGMPIHYHLQTRFRGAPRWSLVSSNEVEEVQVLYGPYSAEYSGNAMGGVVNFKTRRPTSQQLSIEVGAFSQAYDDLQTNEDYTGYRTHVSYEDRYKNLGFAVSYTRLENESQPQTQYFRTPDTRSSSTAFATNAVPTGNNEFGEAGIYFGDSGPEDAETDLFKLKLFYDLNDIEFRGSIAYEERTREEKNHNNFLRDNNGAAIFDREVDINGQNFDTSNFGTSAFQERTQERESLLVGLGASKEFSSGWYGDVFLSHFELLDDEEERTGANPNDPNFASVNQRNRGRFTEYDDTGWNIFDLQLATDTFLDDENQRLAVGFHYDSYELNFNVDNFNSITGTRPANETDGDRSTGRADSGGEARTLAVYAQYGLKVNDEFDVSLGLRYEDWEGDEGYIGGTDSPDRSEEGFSPKFSVAYTPNPNQTIRYSVARAMRFPVIEEIFVNNADTRGGSIADANLEPETGIFHNLSFNQNFSSGSLTLNLFHEEVDDVIFNQTSALSGVTTFLPVGEVTTQGAEVAAEVLALAGLPLNLRFNVSYTDSEITENVNNPALEDKQFPRIPLWRSNLTASYQINHALDVGVSVRYASNSFGELDNSDRNNGVFGSHTDYTFVGSKLNWQATDQVKLSVGIENMFKEEAYVFHPWPGRTYHASLSYSLN